VRKKKNVATMNSAAFDRHCQLFFSTYNSFSLRTVNTDSAATTPASTMPSSPASARRRFGAVRTAAFLLSAVVAAVFPQRYPRIATASAAQLDDELLSAAVGFASPPPPPDPVKKVS
jgi:hypothetical protein